MGEVDKLLNKLAIEVAISVLTEERESPGSYELVNVEAAREILSRRNLPETTILSQSPGARDSWNTHEEQP
jgi:hypothetical protein